jgi:hypothetical protein
MTELIIFTAPKPFTDPHIAVIQRNAIRSWQQLGAGVQVLLIGEEDGLAQAAEDLGVTHLPQVARNELGTPLVSSLFALARQASDAPLLAYVNADILLPGNLLEVIHQVSAQAADFLLIGQRWDLDVTEPLDFSSGWETHLQDELRRDGRLHPPAGSDYFVFPRHLLTEIPDFAIGRAGWDNWMIYHGVRQPWPVIDATPDLTVIHQNHDYSHMPDGKPHYGSEETLRNAALGGGMHNMYLLLDAQKELRDGRVRRPRPNLARLIRRLERWVQPEEDSDNGNWRADLTRRLRRWRRRLR